MFGRNIAAADLHWRTLEREAAWEAHADAIHDLRVALRRIGALQSIFLGPLPAGFARGGSGDMRRLMKALGRVRELDVTAGVLGEERRHSRRRQRDEAVRRCLALRERRWKRLRKLLAEFNRGEYIRKLEEAAGQALVRRTPERVSFEQSARKHVLPLWRKFTRDADVVAAVSSDAEPLHQMRIAGRPLRYVM